MWLSLSCVALDRECPRIKLAFFEVLLGAIREADPHPAVGKENLLGPIGVMPLHLLVVELQEL